MFSRSISALLALGFMVLLLIPSTALAMAPASPGAPITGTVDKTFTGTIQITASDPLAIKALLEPGTGLPGGYASHTSALFWAFIFGCLGGLVAELITMRGTIELPHWFQPEEQPAQPEHQIPDYAALGRLFDLGSLGRVFIGGMAAVAILLVVTPEGRIQFHAAAAVAGSAGAAIFDQLRGRLAATLAAAQAAELQARGQQLDVTLGTLEGQLTALQAQARSAGPAAAIAADEQAAAAPPSFDPTLLDQMERTLGEARGIQGSLKHR